MHMTSIPFDTVDWSREPTEEHQGVTGVALWKTRVVGDPSNPIRVRLVEYSPGYRADHWCRKGHILFCLRGKLQTTLEDGRVFELEPGMSYHVADNAEAHQSFTEGGATLFIVD